MEIIIYIFVSIAIISLQAITPFVIRKSECFGVNVGERANRNAELTRLKKTICWASGFVDLFRCYYRNRVNSRLSFE